MDFQKLLENKPLLYAIIGGIVLVLALFIVIGIVAANSGSNDKGGKTVSEMYEQSFLH